MSSAYLNKAFDEAMETLNRFKSSSKNLELVSQGVAHLSKALANGNKVFSCGNGGSLCDAMHFAEELTGRFKGERNPLPAMAITDQGHMSCVANDYGNEFIFSRFLEAWGNKGDILLAISTSGNSPNVINAVQVAKKKGMISVGLLGKGGGKLKDQCDLSIVIDSSMTERIQEMHIKIIHTFIEGIERELFPENYPVIETTTQRTSP